MVNVRIDHVNISRAVVDRPSGKLPEYLHSPLSLGAWLAPRMNEAHGTDYSERFWIVCCCSTAEQRYSKSTTTRSEIFVSPFPSVQSWGRGRPAQMPFGKARYCR